MRCDVEAPEITIVMKTILVQRREFSTWIPRQNSASRMWCLLYQIKIVYRPRLEKQLQHERIVGRDRLETQICAIRPSKYHAVTSSTVEVTSYLFRRVSEHIAVEVLDMSEIVKGKMLALVVMRKTHRPPVIAEIFTAYTPQVISIGTSSESRIGSPTWRSFHKLFSYLVSVLPFSSNLLFVQTSQSSQAYPTEKDSDDYLVKYSFQILIIFLFLAGFPNFLLLLSLHFLSSLCFFSSLCGSFRCWFLFRHMIVGRA